MWRKTLLCLEESEKLGKSVECALQLSPEMMDRILYFPYISIPDTPWLARALLYWDRIGSIVPYEYVRRPEALGPYMQELVQTGLVEQIFPEEHLHKIPRFQEAFIDFIDKNERANQRRFPTRMRERIHLQDRLLIHGEKLAGRRGARGQNMASILQKQKQKRTVPFRIHTEKLRGIAGELERRSLARRAQGDWIEVEPYTAHHFMSYLASLLGNVTGYQPATDGFGGLSDLSGNSAHPRHIFQLRNKLRMRVLHDVLPSPVHIEDTASLVAFKVKYGMQLTRFRRHVEDFLIRLETALPEQEREMIARFHVETQEEMEELAARMRERKWRSVGLTTVCAVASSLIPLVKAIEENQKAALWAAVPGLIAAIGSALNARQVKDMQSHPLAYALIARQSFWPTLKQQTVLDPFIGGGGFGKRR